MILGHAGVIWEARGFKEILSFIHMKSNMPIIQVLFKTSCSSQMKKTFATTRTTEMLFALHFHTMHFSQFSIFFLFHMGNCLKDLRWLETSCLRSTVLYLFRTWAGDVGPVGQTRFILRLRNLWKSGSFHSGSISQLVPSFLSQALCSCKSGLFR